MSKLKIITASRMQKLLLRIGFKKVRQKGSHVFYQHADGRVTTVPFHKGRVLAHPLIREILREIELSVDECNKYLSRL